MQFILQTYTQLFIISELRIRAFRSELDPIPVYTKYPDTESHWYGILILLFIDQSYDNVKSIISKIFWLLRESFFFNVGQILLDQYGYWSGFSWGSDPDLVLFSRVQNTDRVLLDGWIRIHFIFFYFSWRGNPRPGFAILHCLHQRFMNQL